MSSRLYPPISLMALAMLACDGPIEPMDASVRRDAQVQEGGLLDAGPPPVSDASAARDAARDAGPPLCVWDACDPRAADGCEDASCALWSAEPSCETDRGGLGRDAACTTVSDCAPGLACFLVEGAGVCGRICCPGDDAACAEGSTCGGSGVLIDGTSTSWGRCLDTRRCDVHRPREQCEDREGCYIVDAVGMTECRVAGTAGVGDACAVQEDCMAGLFCGGVGATRCIRICRIGEDDCEVGESCVAQAHTPSGSGLCAIDGRSAI